MEKKSDLPIVSFASPAEFDAWLAEHHASSRGVWIRMAKKASGLPSIDHAGALDVALCYGWIDGQAASDVEPFWLQRFTPRRPGSKWSQINCAKVTALIEQGRMKPAGLREIDAAKQDGRWERAYASSRTIVVPDDLQQELDANPSARASFEALDSRNRYAMLYRIHDAKRPETRRRRIDQFVAMLSEGRTIH